MSAHASRDGRWLAYLVSDGGSDWTTIRLLELGSGREIDDVVEKVKFSEATWLPDDASYLYLHFETTGSGVGTEAEALPGGRLRRHRVGEPQADDELVLEFPDDPRLGISPKISHDGRWVAAHLPVGTSEKNRLWFLPVVTEAGASSIGEPLKLVDDVHAGYYLVRTDGSTAYLLTDHEAPMRRVVSVDLEAFASTRLPRARGRDPGVRAPAGAGRGRRRRAGRGAPGRRPAAGDPVDARRRVRSRRRPGRPGAGAAR